MKTALTIAGSDSSGGAGIQADIKTMTANGVYAMSVITALTAQNTMGVRSVQDTDPGNLADQLDAVFEDIRPDAVKTGMIPLAVHVDIIVDKLKEYRAENIVTDPVMTATSGSVLSGREAQQAVWEKMFPMAKVITPNIPEAEVIAGIKIRGPEDVEKAAERIGSEYGCAVLLKGGHGIGTADDFLYEGKGTGSRWFRGKRIENPNSHGTGCTLSSALACGLAKGMSLSDAVGTAKEYISGAMSSMMDLGRGKGPLDHGFDINSRFVR